MGKFKQSNKKGNKPKPQSQHKQIQKNKQPQQNKVLHEQMKTELNIKAQKKAQQEYEAFKKKNEKQQKIENKKKQQEELEQEELNEDDLEESVSESSQNNEQQQKQQQNEEKQQQNTESKNNENKEIEEEEEEEQVEFLQKDDIKDKRKVIVVLEGCMLEVAKIKSFDVLLNSDEHKGYITNKLNRDFSLYRPDVVHHSLLSLLDSPLNKAGLLQVYIHTESNVLIEINPSTKIPRTYKRFASLMVQLLDKLRIRAVQSSETLLKVIKNPITDHLPQNCVKIGTSCQGRLVDMNKFVNELPENTPVCYAVGGVSKGNPGGEAEYVEDIISVSKYSLSAGYCLSRMLGAYEQKWNII